MSWYGAYDLAWAFAQPMLEAPLPRGDSRDIGRRSTLAERRGQLPKLAWCVAPRIWMHATSVGEMRAARALADLFVSSPVELLLTTSNEQGLAVGRAWAEDDARCRYVGFLPWDRRTPLRRFMAAARPDALVVLETEIWPNLLRVCAEHQVPVFWANARIYPKDVARYRLIRPLLRQALRHVVRFASRDENEADRLRQVGAPADRIEVAGDLKSILAATTTTSPQQAFLRPPAAQKNGPSDHLPDHHDPDPGDAPRPTILGACTARGEEQALLLAYTELQQETPNLRLVLAPRNPRRAANLMSRVRSRHPCVAWDLRHDSPHWSVAVVDRIGSLPRIYGEATVVFVGGSLTKRGGHNPYEALAAWTPLIAGPHVAHFANDYEALRTAKAMMSVRNTRELVSALRTVLASPTTGERLAANGFQVLTSLKQQATQSYSSLIETILAHATASARRRPGRE